VSATSSLCISTTLYTLLEPPNPFQSCSNCASAAPTSSRQPLPRVDRISQLTGPRPVFRIPLVAVQIQLVRARGRLHTRLIIDSINPRLPSTSFLGLGPASVRTQHASQPQHPRRDLYVNKRDLRTEEERAGLVGCRDEFVDLIAELLGVRDLVVLILCLQELVEHGDHVAIDVV
jgi:hypothetical protein